MTPADIKDWWLAAAAFTTVVAPSLRAEAATTESPAGVVAATVGEVRNISGNEVLFVGGNMFQGQTLETGAGGALHILFMDQSSMTLGADSNMTIDHFAYDPETNVGKIAVTLNKGALRVVGGKISKTTATEVRTDVSLVELRGGIAVVESRNNQVTSAFLFGQSMTVHRSGNSDAQPMTQTVTRPGFGVTSTLSGPSDPQRLGSTEMNTIIGNFETRSQTGGNAGGAQPGTVGTIATGGLNTQNAPSQTLAPDRTGNVVSSTLQFNPPSTTRLSQDQDQSQNTQRGVINSDASKVTS